MTYPFDHINQIIQGDCLGRFRQASMVRAVSPSEKKAVVYHTVHWVCKWQENHCGTIVSIYTKGWLCNKHRDIQDARDAIAALEAQRIENIRKAETRTEYKKLDSKKRYKLTAWAKKQREKGLTKPKKA